MSIYLNLDDIDAALLTAIIETHISERTFDTDRKPTHPLHDAAEVAARLAEHERLHLIVKTLRGE